MRIFNKTLCVILSLPLLFSNSNAMPLKELLQAVKQNNLDIRESRALLQAEQENLNEVRASYLPSINFQSSIQSSRRESELQNGTIFDENTTPQSLTLQLTQNLYSGGQRRLNAGRVVSALNANKEDILNRALSYYSEVTQLYFSLLQLQDTIELRKETINLLHQQKLAAQTRHSKGEGTITEIEQASARLAEEAARIAQDQFLAIQLRGQLNLFTGMDVVSPIRPKPATIPLDNLEPLIEQAIAFNPALKGARYAARSAKFDIALSQAANAPTVNFTAQASAFRETSPTIDRDDELRAGLTLTVPLYNGGLSTSRTRRAIASHKAAQIAERQLHNQISQQIRDIWYSRQATSTLVEARAIRLTAARNVLVGVRKGKDAGLFNTIDVLNAIEEENNAKIGLIEAEHQFALLTHLLLLNTGLLNP